MYRQQQEKERAARERDTRAALSRREGNWAGIQVATLPNRNRDGHPLRADALSQLIGLLALAEWASRFRLTASRASLIFLKATDVPNAGASKES